MSEAGVSEAGGDVVLVTVLTERLPQGALDGRVRQPGQVAIGAAEWDAAGIPPDELAQAVMRAVRLGRMWEIFDRIAGRVGGALGGGLE